MTIFDSVGNFVTSTVTLGHCDDYGCSKSANKGVVGNIYHSVADGGSSPAPSDPLGSLKSAFTDMPDGTKQLLVALGIGVIGLIALDIVITII